MSKVFLSPWPSFSQEESDAVSRVLLSNKVNYWTGQEGRQFEKEFADFSDSEYAIAVANGTVALDLALYGLGVSSGDEVIVTSRTFLASASAVVTCGATPVFADVDINSQNITADSIREVMTNKTKAIICVHLAGLPCEMDEIMALAKENGVFVIEDCAQAHGAMYKGRSVGSIGDVGAWSFCQDKIMTTGGEGGMVTTNNKALWEKMWAYKDHGKSFDAVYNYNHPPGFRWLHESFGTNWRLTEMQSVIGRIQIKHMPMWSRKRQENAKAINRVCEQFSVIRVPSVPSHVVHACYKHYVFVRPEYLAEGWSRDRIVDEVNARGVPCFQGTCSEIYLEKAFDNSGFRPDIRLPNAKELGETSLMFLVHPTLLEEEVRDACEVIGEVLALASSS
ncbi:DegT/DnrJ/EryC1/StrS aminotransferase family protein [Dasania sp. GY-MA-18]|uniref:DegT/DnrJ/EryC1/StrS aminotransferase family protein n=1 Tax=Dasania phycosphaerae TaxID=2950436 RepID=A0A9J6RJL6_9GAMM|nr:MULTISPECIES: DegT/DnrJ/EryC1/StrS aminotransferase family protein [Dasania]MCR8922133.1 DegT/DnrJ/EryC1/StrS aminotransferase family protein [Dasania sp. GY-MA-18]MCZ0864561.1 DegT/DnrJ/EryC1/StrS aminotransferase family protein [Dasania phycosphaerae]MCZ0868289.1 DegT/DnrJ/EryC1/StrS aminotransferase family protein [Dasania phycosphaerae]